MTTNSQGWLFKGEGAQVAASRIFSIVFSSIGSGRKFRQLRLSLIAVKRSISVLLSSIKVQIRADFTSSYGLTRTCPVSRSSNSSASQACVCNPRDLSSPVHLHFSKSSFKGQLGFVLRRDLGGVSLTAAGTTGFVLLHTGSNVKSGPHRGIHKIDRNRLGAFKEIFIHHESDPLFCKNGIVIP
jgi:hypothetical protein